MPLGGDSLEPLPGVIPYDQPLALPPHASVPRLNSFLDLENLSFWTIQEPLGYLIPLPASLMPSSPIIYSSLGHTGGPILEGYAEPCLYVGHGELSFTPPPSPASVRSSALVLSALLPPFSGFSPAFQHIGAGWGFLESSFLSL